MKKELKQSILLVVFILSLVFVWGQSCVSKSDSETTSDAFVDIIKPLEEIKPNEVYTSEYVYYNHLIRKGAHVFEFFIIGVELALIVIMFSRKKNTAIVLFWNSLMAGMMIGLIDETIQIFANRGTLVSDVWFDVLGTGIGAGLVSIIKVLKKKQVDIKTYGKSS